MSTTLLERSREIFRNMHEPTRPTSKRDAWSVSRTGEHGRLTLDELITGVWEGLAIRDIVHCPACGGAMQSRSAVRAGICSDCGASLS
jgi:hypothetical protein